MSTLKGRMGGVKREKAQPGQSLISDGTARARKLRRGEENGNGIHSQDTDADAENGEECEDVQDTPVREREGSEPNWDRYSLRSRYEALRMQVNSIKGQLAQVDNSQFKDILATAGVLHKHVRKPREQVKDAEVHIGISTELLDVVKNAKMKAGMSCDEFLGSLVSKFGLPNGAGFGRTIDLEALGLAACGVMRFAPGLSTMVGPMDVERKARQMRPRAPNEGPTQITQPGKVADVNPDDPSTETDANIKTMFTFLKAHRRVPFDNLILNRESFPQTVENVFALSFLVKDGRVQLQTDANGLLEVAPMNAPTHAQRASGEVKNSQFIFRMDMKCWRIMRDRIPVGEEIMPNRAPVDSPDAETGVEEECVGLADDDDGVEAEDDSARRSRSRRSHRM